MKSSISTTLIFSINIFSSICLSQKNIYEEPTYFRNKVDNKLKIKTKSSFQSLLEIDGKDFTKYKFQGKNHYYLNLKESTEKSIAIKLNNKLESTLKIFVIDLNRNGWIGPYQNLNNLSLPKITDRIKSDNILLELIQDENEQLINPFIDILYFDNSSKKNTKSLKKKNKRTTLKRNHRRNILLCGYWPPSNECIRPFSRNQELNTGGWIGQNREGSGFDVVS